MDVDRYYGLSIIQNRILQISSLGAGCSCMFDWSNLGWS